MLISLNQQSKLTVTHEAAFVTFAGFNVPDSVHYGYSTRLLGCSRGIFASMNLGFNRGDDRELVSENYRRISGAIGLPADRLVLSAQTHSRNVRKVSSKDCGNGISRENAFTDTDALMTDEKNVPLVIFTSDCVPVFLYDPDRPAIALVHAGWRGTVSGIVKETVRAMENEYGSKPERILAAIGPSICKECFEIGPEVAEEFCKAYSESDIVRILKPGTGDRSYADLWEANRVFLKEAGLKESNITVSGLCTMCRPDLFFSHRATNGRRGSNAGFLMLCEESHEKP